MKQNRRRFNAAFKAEVAIEAIKGLKTISEIAQQYELHPVQVTQWKKEFLARSVEVFESDSKHEQELERLRKERDKLFREIGELKFENSWYKKITVMSVEQRKAMVDQQDNVSL